MSLLRQRLCRSRVYYEQAELHHAEQYAQKIRPVNLLASATMIWYVA